MFYYFCCYYIIELFREFWGTQDNKYEKKVTINYVYDKKTSNGNKLTCEIKYVAL
jgi:hypothetical protein